MRLLPGYVDIWRARFSEFQPEPFRHLLSSDECMRADRFRFPEHRARFTIGRALLRKILSRYTGIAPQKLVFAYSQHGKPELYTRENRIFFNLSHSRDLFLCAIAEHPLGIDCEAHRPDIHCENIAHRYFSPSETRALLAFPEKERTAAFFRGWTRKEAFIKARGDGLFLLLDSFSVPLENSLPGTGVPVSCVTDEKPGNWRLYALTLPDEAYYGAVVVEGEPVSFRWFDAGKELN